MIEHISVGAKLVWRDNAGNLPVLVTVLSFFNDLDDVEVMAENGWIGNVRLSDCQLYNPYREGDALQSEAKDYRWI